MNMGRKLECVIGTVERALDVARHGVEPLHVPVSVAARAPTLSTNMCVWPAADEGADGTQSVAADLGVYERDLGCGVTQTRRISCDCGLTPTLIKTKLKIHI